MKATYWQIEKLTHLGKTRVLYNLAMNNYKELINYLSKDCEILKIELMLQLFLQYVCISFKFSKNVTFLKIEIVYEYQ